jgi:serine/threonine protein kinase
MKLSKFVGTPLYQSPEQIEGLYYNEKVDIFAMGLILYELCASFKTGMERKESLENLRKESNIREDILTNYKKECELIKWMTKQKPSERPSAKEILESNIFLEWKAEF